MREQTRGYADAVLEDAEGNGRAATLAGDLAGVRDLLVANPELGAVLADPGVPPHSRRGVLVDLLGSRIDPASLRLLQWTVETERAPDLLDAIDWLAVRSAAARDHRRAVGGVFGRRTALDRVDGYATAALEPVRDGADAAARLADIEDELFRFARIVEGDHRLEEALTTRDVPQDARRGIVTSLLGGKVADVSARLAGYATTVGRPHDYIELLDALVARVAAETERLVADVRAVVALTAEQEQRLAAALSRILGQRVDVRVIVDPDILGGFVATIGDTVVDGSVRHRLERLRDRLVTPEATAAS